MKIYVTLDKQSKDEAAYNLFRKPVMCCAKRFMRQVTNLGIGSVFSDTKSTDY